MECGFCSTIQNETKYSHMLPRETTVRVNEIQCTYEAFMLELNDCDTATKELEFVIADGEVRGGS